MRLRRCWIGGGGKVKDIVIGAFQALGSGRRDLGESETGLLLDFSLSAFDRGLSWVYMTLWKGPDTRSTAFDDEIVLIVTEDAAETTFFRRWQGTSG